MRLARLPLLAVLLASVALQAPDAGAARRRIRFEAPPGQSLLVHGEYPEIDSSCVSFTQPVLHARYRGAVEVGRAADGSLFLIGELGFEDYLKGIAEVPRSWPMEALKAQVVAARTYAMNRLVDRSDEARALGYDLCATVACQVYVGMGVEAGPNGERWVAAVDETAGQVLLHEGEPAVTFYSSTSNGRTYPNEKVFGGTPLPYLRGIVEEDDGGSPLAEWQVRMPLDDLSRFLRAGGAWRGGPIERVRQRGHKAAIRGGGRRVTLTLEDLRDELNANASCLDPDYPSTEPDGYRLPQTVPSDWYELRQEGADAVLDGRGWGHGVGMVQWGAKGKADRGLAHDEILAAYYGGLRPEPVAVPETIRVLVAEGLQTITVVPAGDATVTGHPEVPDAPWRIAGGRRLDLSTGTEPAPALELRAASATAGPKRLRIRGELSRDAKLRVELLRGDDVAAATPDRAVQKGTLKLRQDYPAVDPGSYAARIVADDGVDRIAVEAGVIQVPEGLSPVPAPSPTPEPEPEGTSEAESAPAADEPDASGRLLLGAGIVLLVLLLAAVAGARRRGGSHRA